MKHNVILVLGLVSIFASASVAIGQEAAGCSKSTPTPNAQLVPVTKAGIANFAKVNGGPPYFVKFNVPFCDGVTPIVVLTPYKHGAYSIANTPYYVQNVTHEGFEIVMDWPGGSGDANISLTGWVAVEPTETLPGYTK